MSGFNTKTPMMDWSPWMRRDFSSENRGGALADAFKAVGQTADGYGETNDKNLLAGLANETDSSKIDPTQFYSQANALKGKTIIDQNKDRVFKDEQQKRENELNARNDANYYLGVFNKEAAGDALKMDKPTFDAKYANAGGLDWAMMYDVQNKKEDRTWTLEDRQREIKKDNLQMQSTQSQINRNNEESNYLLEQRKQKDMDVKNTNDVLSKYNSWEEYKNSEDWKNPNYSLAVKDNAQKFFASGKKDVSLTDQIKLEEIKARQSDITRANEEYKTKTGRDLNKAEISDILYQGKYPDVISPDKKKEISDKTNEKLTNMITGLEDLKRFKESYKPEFTGFGNAFTGMVGDAIGTQANFINNGKEESAFRTQLPLMTGPITKAIYGGNASDKDRASIEAAMPNFRDQEKDWKAKTNIFYQKSLENIQTNLDVLKANGQDTSAYEKQIEPLKKYLDEQNALEIDKPEPKNINWQKPQKINLEEKLKELEQSKNKNITNQNKIILTPSEAESLGIRFP